MPSDHSPPHLATPSLTYLTEDQWEPYFEAVSRGFQEEHTPDETATKIEKTITDYDRIFGFKVGDRWVASGGDFSRKMTLPGGTSLPIAAVSVVTVSPPYRRRGLLREMMTHQLKEVHRRGESVAALWASEAQIYGRFGYGPSAPRARLRGPTRTTEFLPGVDLGKGSVDEVSVEVYLPAAKAIHAKLLPQRHGALDRSDGWWELGVHDPAHSRDGLSPIRFVLHYDAKGTPDGFAEYRTKDDWGPEGPNNEVRVLEVDAANPTAYARLWRYLFDHDLVRTFMKRNAPVDDPVRFLVADQRAITTEITDGIFTRLVDVPGALTARRYATEIDTVIEIDDPLMPHNSGRWHLVGGRDGATCKPARRKPDLSMGILELGTIYLGGPLLSDLSRAGRVTEHKKGALTRASLAFGWDRKPFCPDMF